MGEPELSFWSVAIGRGIVGGIIGALAESYSAYLLEGLRGRRRERKELIDLARNWEAQGRPDRFRHVCLRRADLRGVRLGEDEQGRAGADLSYADLRKADLSDANLRGAKIASHRLRFEFDVAWKEGHRAPTDRLSTG